MSAREAILGKLRAGALASAPALPTLPDVAGWYAAQRRSETTAERSARLRTLNIDGLQLLVGTSVAPLGSARLLGVDALLCLSLPGLATFRACVQS